MGNIGQIFNYCIDTIELRGVLLKLREKRKLELRILGANKSGKKVLDNNRKQKTTEIIWTIQFPCLWIIAPNQQNLQKNYSSSPVDFPFDQWLIIKYFLKDKDNIGLWSWTTKA